LIWDTLCQVSLTSTAIQMSRATHVFPSWQIPCEQCLESMDWVKCSLRFFRRRRQCPSHTHGPNNPGRELPVGGGRVRCKVSEREQNMERKGVFKFLGRVSAVNTLGQGRDRCSDLSYLTPCSPASDKVRLTISSPPKWAISIWFFPR
jgi:hypothetical protein